MKQKWFRTAGRILVPALAVMLASLALAAGCGGGSTDVTGVYKLKASSDLTATLTLKSGGEGSYSITEGAGIPVTYEVKDNKVTLMGADGQPIPNATFTVTDEGLEDPTGNVYEKQ